MFGKIIGFVQGAGFPINMELALADAVANPVEAHINGFGAFLFDSVVGNASCSTVVCYNGCGRLRMTEFLQADSKGARIFAIVEKGGKLSFGGAGDDFAEDLAENIDGAIGWRSRRVGRRRLRWVGGDAAEKIITGGTGTSFGGGEIRGVTLNMECHVAGNEADSGVRVSGAVVEELSYAFQGCFGDVSLLGGESADGHEHGRIDGAGVEEQSAEHLLDVLGVGSV